MRLWLAVVGRSRAGPARDLYEEYARRIAWPLTLKEIEVRKRLPAKALKQQEAGLLLGSVPADATVVALDETGAALTSEAFAGRLGSWRDAGVGDLAFLIGGADGLDETVRQRAAFVLALGRMTWPHMLVRGMLVEQLYRAQQILSGHPYHRR